MESVEAKWWDLVVAVAVVREKVDMPEFHIVVHSLEVVDVVLDVVVVDVGIDLAVAEEERNFGEEGK